MQLFQICGNFCSSWIPFSPSLNQVQFLPIPSIGQKTEASQWLQRAKSQRECSMAELCLFSQEAGFLSSTQRWFSLLLQEFKPFVKLIQNSQKVLLDLLKAWEEED